MKRGEFQHVCWKQQIIQTQKTSPWLLLPWPSTYLVFPLPMCFFFVFSAGWRMAIFHKFLLEETNKSNLNKIYSMADVTPLLSASPLCCFLLTCVFLLCFQCLMKRGGLRVNPVASFINQFIWKTIVVDHARVRVHPIQPKQYMSWLILPRPSPYFVVSSLFSVPDEAWRSWRVGRRLAFTRYCHCQ